uniref:GH92 family glycosyl hydrolase n=1 Tax=Prevotella sp. TaxID=59823 RepID=UPI0040279317
MKRILVLALYSVLGLSSLMAQDYSRYVDPRIGNEGLGRTFPGPCMPYGMAKPGPDAVTMPNAGWAPIPEPVKGFSQMHVSGTGGGQKYGNILIQPYLDSKEIIQKRVDEKISLGYYVCTFENGIRTEITASERCAFYRLDFGKKQKGKLLIDVATFLGIDTIPDKREAQQYVDSYVTCDGKYAVSGWSTVRGGWNNGGPYTVYFYLQSDVPLLYNNVKESKTRLDVTFLKSIANLKLGISHISIAQAKRNIPTCGFDAQLKHLRETWNGKLRKIEIAGTEKQKRMFYTGIYHTMLMPVDKSGENPHFSDTPYYDDYYAIWDTYRTSMPLLTLIDEDKQRDMIHSLLNIYKHDGYMPDARSGNWNGRTQGGSNAEIVIADAFAKGMEGINYELALQAMVKDAEVPPMDVDSDLPLDSALRESLAAEKHGRGGLKEYNSLGYIPYGIDRAGNRTVEYSYDDWCIAQVAKGLHHPDLYEKYMKRSGNWRNLWRSDYEWQGMRGFIMPRDAAGRWLDSVPWGKSKVYHPQIPYLPDTKVAPWYLPWWSTFFYEALSAEYSLSIPHDVPGLIEACGGKDAFIKRLDTFFVNKHYNVANEPSFLTPYLYHWVGRPDLSVERINQIVHDNYDDTPNGLPGNDDSGAMSSWLVFNMMGIYPVAGQNLYLIGSPMIPSYTIHLPNGKDLKVVAKGNEWNVKSQYDEAILRGTSLTHRQLLKGGTLVLPDCRKVAPSPTGHVVHKLNVDNIELVRQLNFLTSCSAIDESSTYTLHRSIGKVNFILNRQYRNWEVAIDSTTLADTLLLRCNESIYLIPKRLVDEADGFYWDSPQKGKNIYDAKGTFLFVSRKAIQQLRQSGVFIYNGITWRQIAQDASSITVKADVDGTLMQIATNRELPWVLKMENNPLGIDWKLVNN